MRGRSRSSDLELAENLAVCAGKREQIEIFPRFPMTQGVIPRLVLQVHAKGFQSDPVARDGVFDRTQWLARKRTELQESARDLRQRTRVRRQLDVREFPQVSID